MIVPSFGRWLVLLLVLSTLSASPARAALIWYNGDDDGRDSQLNENKVPINIGTGYSLQKSLVYDNFVVPTGQIWTISSVFSVNQMAYYAAPTAATWEIRQDLSAGYGGALRFSGDTTASQTAITASSGLPPGYTEDQVSAAVTGVILLPGTYWLTVAPDSVGYYGDQSYIATTSGVNSVGLPGGKDNNSFIASGGAISSLNFAPASSILSGEGPIDFSMGIVGTVMPVPEPASLGLVAFGLAGLSIALSRSRRSPLA